MRNESVHIMRRPAALILVCIALVVVVTGLFLRWSRAEALESRAQVQSTKSVALISPTAVPASTIELSARIEAWSRAPIHARVSGYLQRWLVDIGDKVKAGQVLAEIETPDLDQQILQARAELARARSDASLAESTAKRWQALLASDSVSRQEAEERAADFQAKKAEVSALTANVERLLAQQQFKRLIAPFDGVITARNTDVGALINGGMNSGSELFVVSDTRRLRVYVDVPQRQVASIQEGSPAKLSVPERPDHTYSATVQSLAQAINTGTGAMRVQLTVDNPSGELLPGGFALVRFDGQSAAAQQFGLPPSALILGKSGVQVASVGNDGLAQLRQVTIARDFGNIIQLAGLEVSDRVINNPPDGIANGDPVRIAVAETEGAKP
ncbi:efflux RND transporter periplasmic adaptor subunit [Pseudomonas syringae]|uniref:Uncharacterized protein n=1 Tax=Pseudomonas syringae pv. daphniphylli TaxID=264455 RepID=A0A9X0H4D0_PSESX|nr:efflux RND transporter periplasmic adaptor subunit [Pseudomonas syringae]KPX12836.1 hypothetical protein ALO73_200133 [Pseudomonas syringae pv. daphniphylli]KWS87850.1 efflux transporter periplasmic adaptor subunit [Pseudomonas syringae pv. daphniphylli]